MSDLDRTGTPEKGGKGVPLSIGSYWCQTGGEPHTTKCSSKEPCLALLVSDGKVEARVLKRSSAREGMNASSIAW